MKTFLVLATILLLAYAGQRIYLDLNIKYQPQVYHNSQYGYQLKYPPDWKALSVNRNTSTADTIYLFKENGDGLLANTDLPPRTLHYIEITVVPNPNHVFPVDWYKTQTKRPLMGLNATTTTEEDTVFGHESFHVSQYEGVNLKTSEYIIDDNDYLLKVSLVPCDKDSGPVPDQDLSGIIKTMSFDDGLKNTQIQKLIK